MSLRARMVLVAAAAVAGVVVLASLLVYFIVRNELYKQVNRSLQAQAQQISTQGGLEFATAIGDKRYALRIHQPPFANPFQLVDAHGATYQPVMGFDQFAPLLPGVKQAQQVA